MEIADVLPATTIIGSIIVLLNAPETAICIEIITVCRGCWGVRSAQWQRELDGPCVAGRDVSMGKLRCVLDPHIRLRCRPIGRSCRVRRHHAEVVGWANKSGCMARNAVLRL